MRIVLATVLTACVAALPGALPQAAATHGDTGQYVAGGTAVVRAGSNPLVDEGTVICDDGTGVGVGGFCVGFGGGDAVRVSDNTAGEQVAFQVCVDNSGDGVCTSPDFGPCADFVAFSHSDNGSFFNPVGPLPTGFSGPDCGGNLAFPGYVVFLCQGGHADGIDVHTHNATDGKGGVVSGGLGSGNFCGGNDIARSRKPYAYGAARTAGNDGYRGGCGASFLGAPGVQLDELIAQEGGAGQVHVVVAATDGAGVLAPAAPVSGVSCELLVNGVSQGIVLTAPDATGSTAAATSTKFAPEPGDQLELCTTATVGAETFYDCADVPSPQLLPEPVADLVTLLLDTAQDAVFNQLDPTYCPLLADFAGSYGTVTITAEGDVYVGSDLVYDCPPYQG